MPQDLKLAHVQASNIVGSSSYKFLGGYSVEPSSEMRPSTLHYGSSQWGKALVVSIFIVISPTSSWAEIAYLALHSNIWTLFHQNSLVSEPRQIGRKVLIGDTSAPALAIDGARVAFEVQGGALYVCPLDSSTDCQTIRIDGASAARPAWHPKKNEIVFARYLTDQKNEESDLFITRSNLSTSTPLVTQTGLQDYPDISPDGRSLVYTSASTISPHRGGVQVIQQLWIMDLQTGVARQLILSNAQDTHPDWAPVGEILAFASNRTGQFEIWVVKENGEGLRQVTTGPGAKTWPAWFPDGKSIMFTMTKDGHQRLWIIDADGSNLRQFEPFGPGSDVDVRDADWR